MLHPMMINVGKLLFLYICWFWYIKDLLTQCINVLMDRDTHVWFWSFLYINGVCSNVTSFSYAIQSHATN